jgi:hypothetical protein
MTLRFHLPLEYSSVGRTFFDQLKLPFLLSKVGLPVSGSGEESRFLPASAQYHSTLVGSARAKAGMWQDWQARREWRSSVSMSSAVVPTWMMSMLPWQSLHCRISPSWIECCDIPAMP